MQAEPPSNGIYAILFYGNQRLRAAGRTLPDGRGPKILWLVDPTRAGKQLDLNSIKLGTQDTFHLSGPRITEGTPIQDLYQYNPGIYFPTPGCWRVDITTGSAKGSVTFWVEP